MALTHPNGDDEYMRLPRRPELNQTEFLVLTTKKTVLPAHKLLRKLFDWKPVSEKRWNNFIQTVEDTISEYPEYKQKAPEAELNAVLDILQDKGIEDCNPINQETMFPEWWGQLKLVGALVQTKSTILSHDHMIVAEAGIDEARRIAAIQALKLDRFLKPLEK